MTRYVFVGILIGIILISGIEFAQFATADSDYFRVTYFFKGTLLSLFLAAMSSFYLMYGMAHKKIVHYILAGIMFVVAILVISFSFKFLLLGVVLSAVSAGIVSKQIGMPHPYIHVGINGVLFVYVYYLEFINVGGSYEVFL